MKCSVGILCYGKKGVINNGRWSLAIKQAQPTICPTKLFTTSESQNATIGKFQDVKKAKVDFVALKLYNAPSGHVCIFCRLRLAGKKKTAQPCSAHIIEIQ